MSATTLTGAPVDERSFVDIVVVDDQEPIRCFVRAVLEDEGYAVAEAGNWAEALLAVHSLAPALILLDLDMPVLDGPSFMAAYLRQPGWHAPIVLMTAASKVVHYAADLGAAGYLGKPFALPSLLTTVARFVVAQRAPS